MDRRTFIASVLATPLAGGTFAVLAEEPVMELERFSVVNARVNLRNSWKGQPLKPACASLQGLEGRFEVLWQCDDDEKYPGEYAMRGGDESTLAALERAGIVWLASGDLVISKAVT